MISGPSAPSNDAPLSAHFRNRRARRAEAAGIRRAAWNDQLRVAAPIAAPQPPQQIRFAIDAKRDGDHVALDVVFSDGKTLRLNVSEADGWPLAEKMATALYEIRESHAPLEPEPISDIAAELLAEAEAAIIARATSE